MPSLKALLVAASLAMTVSCMPKSEHPGLVILQRYEAEGRTFTWYGDENPTNTADDGVDPGRLARRCGSNRRECNGNHQAPQSTCATLILSLAGPHADEPIPNSPRAICVEDGAGKCCVSWANPVSNANKGTLLDAAQSVNNNCVRSNGRVSGLTRDTLIGSTCTTQCLSDRPTGCS